MKGNNGNWSAICRFSNAASTVGALFGACRNSAGDSPYFLVQPLDTGKVVYWAHSTAALRITTTMTAGVLAIAGGTAYRDGTAETGSLTYVSGVLEQIRIMRLGSYNDFYFTGNIQAVAFYDAVLTADQVTAITAAMNAL